MLLNYSILCSYVFTEMCIHIKIYWKLLKIVLSTLISIITLLNIKIYIYIIIIFVEYILENLNSKIQNKHIK